MVSFCVFGLGALNAEGLNSWNKVPVRGNKVPWKVFVVLDAVRRICNESRTGFYNIGTLVIRTGFLWYYITIQGR